MGPKGKGPKGQRVKGLKGPKGSKGPNWGPEFEARLPHFLAMATFGISTKGQHFKFWGSRGSLDFEICGTILRCGPKIVFVSKYYFEGVGVA